ncbi:MAG: hypothetical protein KDA74_01405, partial [Planctomycetaceae bacterium]|nr:hypothetical protein [Planctomycetaceae bacterium]
RQRGHGTREPGTSDIPLCQGGTEGGSLRSITLDQKFPETLATSCQCHPPHLFVSAQTTQEVKRREDAE